MEDASELEGKHEEAMTSQVTPKVIPDKAYILQAIDVVLSQCVVSQTTTPDAAVEAITKGLQKVRGMMMAQWPLPDSVKDQLNIGPVAAKNIADWNDDLATSLMVIHHVLKFDGDSLYRIVGAPSA